MFMPKIKPVFKIALFSGVAMSVIMTPSHTYAQVEQATGIADPARIGQELLNIDELPELSAEVKIEKTVLQNAPEGAENITFALDNLEIDGVSAYGAENLNPFYADMLGDVVSLADIYGLANTLTQKYRNDGYILTQVIVPPQTIENGTVQLRVIEGHVDQIIIEGEEGSATDIIRRYASNLKENNILNAQKLERYLLLINDLPGVSARSVLSPSATKTGASDLTIIVERDKYEAEVSLDNHGSRFLGPYQASFSNSLNSVLGFNERISAQFVISGDKNRTDELLFGSLLYEQPINQYGTKVRFLGSITSTEPGFTLDQFDVEGQSHFLSATVTHPFIRSRTTNIFGRASFDLRRVDSKNDLEPTRKDRIRSVRVGATAQFIDTFMGVGVNAIDFEVSQGVDIFGSSQNGATSLTRAAGDPNYTKAELQLQRLQRLTSQLNLLVAGQGQWASSALLSSEEFGVGGTDIGRGYDSSEIVGEDGIAGKVELQWNEPHAIKYVDDYQLYSFFDAGRVWNQDATTSAGKRESISSTGIGIRADLTEHTQAAFSVAFPLTRRIDTTNDRDPRYYVSMTHKF
ncbi:MAG: ShlB/FhaC/HecB family hemolysin secretion/activation protein [Alphaproteobacteria bacterium]